MGKLTLGILLLAAVVGLQLVASKTILKEGETFVLPCRLRYVTDRNVIIQFVREKVVIKMFSSTTTWGEKIIANDTEVDPSITNLTDRYSVVNESGSLIFNIKDVRVSDSGHYLCRAYDVDNEISTVTLPSEELLIRGPLRGLYWTRNHSGLNQDRSFEVEENGTVLVHNYWFGPLITCAVLVTNVEPEVNITIGELGKDDTKDITDQFETRSSTVTIADNVGVLSNTTVFFVKRHKFSETSIRNLHCTASQPGSETLSRSVNVQFISKPPNECRNTTEFKAQVGSNNVQIRCLVPAHPVPQVTWAILHDDRTRVNETSNNPMYKVTNQEIFEGLLTTLTITNITEGTFGRFFIEASNSEGSGTMHVRLSEGTTGGAGMRAPGVCLLVPLCLLLKWMLKA